MSGLELLGMEAPTERTRVRRLPERGSYDRTQIDSILDEALYCHVGIVAPDGYPVVIPTIHTRVGDTLYFHGSPASRLLRAMNTGDEVCVTVTLLDGLVIARSAFHNSMNYRSVVVIGVPRLVESPAEKLAALEAITNHIVRGRWAESRPVTDKEITGTSVAALDIAEASAKIRTGGPVDDEADSDLPIWAGVVPITLVPGAPIGDERVLPGVAPPPNVTNYRR